MKNIYRQQMEKYKLNEKQYSELTGIPLDILKKMLNNEKVSDNMGLNDFFRKNTVKIHEELEANSENTEMESIKLKMEDEEILNWYENEYDKEDLFRLTNTKSSNDFERLYTLCVKGKKASHWFYSCLVGKSNCSREVSKSVKIEFANQLKDILDGNANKYYKKKVATSYEEPIEKLLKWHSEFDYHKFLEENNMDRKQLAKAINISDSTSWALISKRNYNPSVNMLRKVKKYVDSKSKKEEPIEILDNVVETIEIIEDMPKTTMFDGNAYVRELIKSTLTDKEKWLITLFGGNID